jgi:excisionase family DNA binding protein
MEKKLLTVKEVAEMHGITVWRIHQLIKDETLKAVKYGNQYLIETKDAKDLTTYGKPGRPPKDKDDK